MRRARRSFCEILNRVIELVELIIMCHPAGFKLLLGEIEKPSSREIHEMMNAGRDKLPEDFMPTMPNLETEAERIVYDREYFDKSIELAGGWGHIHSVSNEFRNADTRRWSIVVDHVKFVGKGTTRNSSQLNRVAHKYGISARTVTNYRRNFSTKLGEMCLMPTTESYYAILR